MDKIRKYIEKLLVMKLRFKTNGTTRDDLLGFCWTLKTGEYTTKRGVWVFISRHLQIQIRCTTQTIKLFSNIDTKRRFQILNQLHQACDSEMWPNCCTSLLALMLLQGVSCLMCKIQLSVV
ncbi:hypothetical protein CHARACLAT_000743 [Characodon lateralis]|uniref:Uncharacterized protein n=1 Tax=Characodon lateralis TaxID=208331 RepID=A0ABU7DCX3_9TELE|nr:hypothetical protein [Characodon lateralis]